MTIEQTKRIIEVEQAFVDGEEIEERRIGKTEWLESRDPSWNWDMFDYRVKPTPIEG